MSGDKEFMVKITTNWRGGKKVDRIKRVRRKPKIRWQYLGLSDPADVRPGPSMDEIRREVLTLSSRGLGHGVRARSVVPNGPAMGGSHTGTSGTIKRRGATE